MSFYLSLLARIRSHHQLIAALLYLPAPAWKSIITYNQVMAAESQWLASMLLDIIVLTESSPYVVNFHHTISQAQRGNRRYILEEGALLTRPLRGAKECMEKAEFEKAALFQISMPMVEITSAAYDCIAMFERLSTCERNNFNALQNMLIHKLPESMREHKDRLHDLLSANKVSPMIVYTVPSVISLITVALDRAQRSFARPPSLVTKVARQHGSPKCHCFGKDSDMSSVCPTSCSACNEKNCPGKYSGGQACVITPVNPPIMFKNANNQNVPDSIYRQFLRLHANRHGGASAAAADRHYEQTANNRGLHYIANSAVQTNNHGLQLQTYDTWNPGTD